jgi:5-hydroxyisourate hydrolase-like protein (transthyretin family)
VGSGWDFYLYSPTTFEFYFAGSGVEVTFNEANTEATFAMPAFDATATYELVRDMGYGIIALVNNGDEYFQVLKGDDEKYHLVNTSTLTYTVKDVSDPNNPKDLTENHDFKKVGLQILAADGETWNDVTDESDLVPGTYRMVFEGIGDYDGKVYSQELKFFEQMNITFSKGYSTHYYANPLKLAEANDGLKIYAVTAVSTEKVTLTEIESNAIPTKTPFIAYNSTAEALTVAFNLQSGDAVSTATQFKGSATEKTMDAQSGCYVLRNGDSTPTFRLVEGRGTLPAHRCWIELGSNASTRSLGFDFGDGTTGIKTIGQSDDIQSDDYYDLQGRKREGTPQRKGTYIHNGKTIIIK